MRACRPGRGGGAPARRAAEPTDACTASVGRRATHLRLACWTKKHLSKWAVEHYETGLLPPLASRLATSSLPYPLVAHRPLDAQAVAPPMRDCLASATRTLRVAMTVYSLGARTSTTVACSAPVSRVTIIGGDGVERAGKEIRKVETRGPSTLPAPGGPPPERRVPISGPRGPRPRSPPPERPFVLRACSGGGLSFTGLRGTSASQPAVARTANL